MFIMNKSAVFRLKLSFPNVSGMALQQWNYQLVETVARFAYAINNNNNNNNIFYLNTVGFKLI